MGILGLSKLIADVAPEAIKENEIKNYFGRKVAIDASMSLYQFLIAGNICTKCSITSLSEIMGPGFFQPLASVWFLHTSGFLSSVWYVSRNPYSTYKSSLGMTAF